MKKEKLNIDLFFKKHLSDFEHYGQEGNWELMKSILDEQERRKKNRRWFLFFFSFILLLSSGLLMVKTGKNTQEKISITQESSYPSRGTNNPFPTKDVGANQTPIPSAEGERIEDEINKITPVDSNQRLPSQQERTALRHRGNQSKVNDAQTEYSRVDKDTNMVYFANQPSVILLPQTSAWISPMDDEKNGVEKTIQSRSPDSNQPPLVDSVSQTINTQNAPNTIPNLIDSSVIIQPTSDSLVVIAKDNEEVESVDTQVVPAERVAANLFNFFSGLNIYSTGDAFSNKQKIAPLVGLEYIPFTSSKISVGLGIWYSLQGGYKLNDSVTNESYFFDKMVSQQSIQIHKLHKFYFPFSVYYEPAKKHYLIGAFQVSYLLNTIGNFMEINTVTGHTTEINENNAKGYMDGIKPINMAISLGYKYQISKRFDFSTRVTGDLTGPYVKNYFYGVRTTPAWSSQTSLHIKF